HLHLEEGVRRLGDVLEVELVAQVRPVLREHAVAEERVDGAVLPLESQLELGLVVVQLVDVAHDWDCSFDNKSATVPRPGIRRSGASSASGSRTKIRS